MENYCIIPDNSAKFMEFIAELDITQADKNALLSAEVNQVYIDTVRKTWTVYLSACTISHIAEQAVCNELKKRCGIDKVLIVSKRDDVDLYLKNNWQRFTDELAGEQHSVRCLLNNAKWSWQPPVLTIAIAGEVSLKMMMEKEIPQKAAAYLTHVAGQDCNVTIVNSGDEINDNSEICFMTQEYLEAVNDMVMRNQPEDNPIIFGKAIKEEPQPIVIFQEEIRNAVVEGQVGKVELRELRSGRYLLTFEIADSTDGLTGKIFFDNKEQGDKISKLLSCGMCV